MKPGTIFSSLLGTILLCLATRSANATVFNIANGDVTALKAALTTAASNQQSDVINLAANGTYTLTSVDNSTNGPNGLPVIGHDNLALGIELSIHGNGATIQRDSSSTSSFRIFEIVGGKISLQDLIILNGETTRGGGVENSGSGTVTLLNCTFSSHTAGGGACVSNTGTGIVNLTSCLLDHNRFTTIGAGILNQSTGTVNITACTLTFNDAGEGGGAIYNAVNGTVNISSSTLENNGADNLNGGAIFNNNGTITISQSNLNSNVAFGKGGGIYSNGGQATLTDCTLSSNAAGHGGALGILGGGLSISHCQFAGNSTTNNGAAIFNAGTATIDHTGFSSNKITTSVSFVSADPNGSSCNGAAISNTGSVAVTNCTIDSCAATIFGAGSAYGIAIYNDGAGTVNVTDSRINDGRAVFGHDEEGNYGNILFEGGGVFNNSTGAITLTRCTLSLNLLPVGVTASSTGGAVFNNGSGTITVSNSTVAYNRANFGGGIWNNANGAVNLSYSTVTFNPASSDGGIGNVNGPFTVRSSIVALNSTNGADPDVSGNFISGGFNLIGIDQNNGFSQPTDKKGGSGAPLDPKFTNNDLVDNGGPTKTVAILSNSPAINSGDNANAPARDQRNFVRPDAADIGAFEFNAAIPVTLANVSTRAFVQINDNVMIGGFIISGTGTQKVIIRALGPSLSNFGITNPLQNPTLELHDASGVIAINDNWGSAANHQDISNSGFAPSNSLESAILMNLNPGNYTALVKGVNNGTGIALFEGYDLDRPTTSKFGNISTRALVLTGDNVMIGGFIVKGPDSQKVIVRAIGPSLVAFGITNAMADPTIELLNGNGMTIASDDNWKDTQQIQIQEAGLAPSQDAESAIVQTLAPGNYTAIVKGKNDTTGVALVEVYGLN